MPTITHEVAQIKLAALHKLHDLMQHADDPAEARRCATAILRAPVIDDPDKSSTPQPLEQAAASSPGREPRVRNDRTPKPAERAKDPGTDPHSPILPFPLTEHKLKQIYHALATDNTELLEQLIEGDIHDMLTRADSTTPANSTTG